MNRIPQLQPRYRYKIHDKLYDLTDFVKVHPGGIDMFTHLKPYSNITPMIYTYHQNPNNIITSLPGYEIPLTDDIEVHYDNEYTYDKYCDLKKIVYEEIREKHIPVHWSNREIAYNSLMMALYLGMWGCCFWNASNLLMVILGVFTTGWSILVFHEVSHYAGFKNQTYNLLFSRLYPFVNINYWKLNHNFLHHSFTNTEYDHDTDITNVRVLHSQPMKYHHRYQYIYIWIFNMFACIFSRKRTFFNISNTHTYFLLLFLSICKLRHVFIFYITFGFLWMSTVLLPHYQDDIITENKTDFLYNQVANTVNYKTDNPIIRFIVYGVDIHIEHHLFPNIPHSSLRRIKHIVREYCNANNIPYIEKPSVFSAVYSYGCYLYKMGRP